MDESHMHLLSERRQTHDVLWAPIIGCFRKGKVRGTENKSVRARGGGGRRECLQRDQGNLGRVTMS